MKHGITAYLLLAMLIIPSAWAADSEVDSDKIDINDYRVTSSVAVDQIETASDRSKKKSSEKKRTAKIGTTNSATTPENHKKNLLAAPMAVGGVIAGLTVGIPVRIARDVSQDTLRMRDQMTDDVSGADKPDLFARTVGSYTGMAYGLVSGVIKGSIKGTERALDCGSRKPFSKESMSMQDPH